MKLASFLFAALLISEGQPAPPSWWALSSLYVGAVAADVTTTEVGLDHPGFYERNPALGRHPSDTRLMTTAVITTGAIWYTANRVRLSGRPKLARAMLITLTVIHFGLASNNHRIVENSP